MSKLIYTIFFIFILSINPLTAQIAIDIETGAVWNGYNNVEVPLGNGSRFSLTENAQINSNGFYRIQLLFTTGEVHTIRFLYAPLRSISQGNFANEVFFNDKIFVAGTNFTGIYKFNSYRATYRYNFSTSGTIKWGLGLTAKIRDAKIELIGDGTQSAKNDLGFVPLVNFNFEWQPKQNFSFQLVGDALISPYGQGRAEDALLAFRYHFSQTSLKLGYRILEGGANVSEVYNFTLFHYAVLGFTVEL
jgi:hypothetical protein